MKSKLLITLLATAFALPVMAQSADSRPSNTGSSPTRNVTVGDSTHKDAGAPPAATSSAEKDKAHKDTHKADKKAEKAERKAEKKTTHKGGSAATDGGTSTPGTGTSSTTGAGTGPSTTGSTDPSAKQGSYGGR